jgi:cyanophycinase
MPGQIALVGGEEFRTGCEDMDREVMRASGKDPAKVIIIPTAAVTGPAKAANDGVTHFAALGGAATQLMVLDRGQANDPEFIQPVATADVVYFTGGSPDHLLSVLRDSELLRLLMIGLERGMVLGGSSAGAMVMGSVMRRPSPGRWVEGLGIVPGVSVLPHHERSDPATTVRQIQETAASDTICLGIDARTGCLGSPNDWRVVGSGKVTVYQAGEFAVFNSGERLPGGF